MPRLAKMRCFAALMLLLTPGAHGAQPFMAQLGNTPCASVPHLDHPHIVLASGKLRMLVFLPNSISGYYRAERFDWSGVIGCASYQGHQLWGEWFNHYDPLTNDSITGPVEEFRPSEGAQGFAVAPKGGSFVKIGVGELRKTADAPYRFGDSYPIVSNGNWKIHYGARSVTFRQLLRSSGTSYLYTKKLILNREGSALQLRHSLKNLGSQPIVTDVYDHDFYMLDDQPTGAGDVVHFPFTPVTETTLVPDAEVRGHDIIYRNDLAPKQTVATYIAGYGSTPASYSIGVENPRTHLAVTQTADAPISRLYLWSIRSTICPEAYIHLEIPPGSTKKWTITYTFSVSAGKQPDEPRPTANRLSTSHLGQRTAEPE